MVFLLLDLTLLDLISAHSLISNPRCHWKLLSLQFWKIKLSFFPALILEFNLFGDCQLESSFRNTKIPLCSSSNLLILILSILNRKPLSMCKTRNRADTSLIKFLFISEISKSCWTQGNPKSAYFLFFFFLINVCEAAITQGETNRIKIV